MVPSGQFELVRYPLVTGNTLRAWDAADELLLQHVAEHHTLDRTESFRVLVLNDSHGALCTALHEWNPCSWSDSFLSFQAVKHNFLANDIQTEFEFFSSVDEPDGVFDLVLIRVPKSMAFFQEQLTRLRPHVSGNTKIIAGAMLKHLPKSAFRIFEQCLGPVTTSLAVKKARLLFASVDESKPIQKPAAPTEYTDSSLGFALANHSNVFSREKLDLGARLFLSQFHKLPVARNVFDLGCGNGVLGLSFMRHQANACVNFVDESYSAVASAQYNYEQLFPEDGGQSGHAHFFVANGLELHPEESADLIICNPPFHQQHAITDQLALPLFEGSKRVLEKGGQLWVVANRHLSYEGKLKKLFGNCSQIICDRKFCVYKVVKR